MSSALSVTKAPPLCLSLRRSTQLWHCIVALKCLSQCETHLQDVRGQGVSWDTGLRARGQCHEVCLYFKDARLTFRLLSAVSQQATLRHHCLQWMKNENRKMDFENCRVKTKKNKSPDSFIFFFATATIHSLQGVPLSVWACYTFCPLGGIPV